MTTPLSIQKETAMNSEVAHTPEDAGTGELNDEQVKFMASRFLGWRLPDDFNPDGGISFKAAFNEHTQWPMKHEPVGTNLFDARQAEAMVRYMLEGLPRHAENLIGAAELEVGRYIYRRIEALMDAKPGTAEGAEFVYLAAIAESVEEYGEENCGGESLAPFSPPPPASMGEGELQEAMTAVQEWVDASRSNKPFGMYLDPDHVALVLEALRPPLLPDREGVARALRRHRMERTGRLSAFDPDMPATDAELADADFALALLGGVHAE